MSRTNYYGLAEDDYGFFNSSYEHGEVWNSMAVLALDCCLKYLKYIVECLKEETTFEEKVEKSSLLRTHFLTVLLCEIQTYPDIEVPKSMESVLRYVETFYFTARYPGKESVFVSKWDIEKCKQAVDFCRDLARKTIAKKEGTGTCFLSE